MKHIVIFASGAGTNAEKLITHFANDPVAQVRAVFTNNPRAGVLEVCKRHRTPCFLFSNDVIEVGDKVVEKLQELKCDYIVLAGFLRKIPQNVVAAYPNEIINIHPSLLPKYGGQGMYGNKVHQAVLSKNEKKSGITIHLVNEEYDKGKILAQFSCDISDISAPKLLAERIQELEYKHYATTIKKHIKDV